LASSEKYTYLSSTVVKEMARYGADLSGFVPREILADILDRLPPGRTSSGRASV
jgi:pantetheine-phosphate adenylyltransferase